MLSLGTGYIVVFLSALLVALYLAIPTKKSEHQAESTDVAAVGAAFPSASERFYTIQEISLMWRLSPDAIRRLFRNEPGVLAIGNQKAKNKRTYLTLRIPHSVLERVHRQYSLYRQ